MSMLALDVWRHQMSLMPWHFWQFAGGNIPVQTACNGLTYEYGWQAGDAAGRDDARRALAIAAERISAYLDYPLVPTNRTATRDLCAPQRLALPDAYVQAIGWETLTLLSATEVTYADLDGDGLAETATSVFATSETNPDNLVLMVPTADRYDSADTAARWELRPTRISVSDGIATARLPRWVMARPVLYEGVTHAPLDPIDDSAVLSTIEVYQRSIDTTNALTCAACGCGVQASSTLDAAGATLVGGPAGIVDLCAPCWTCGGGDRLTIRYVAGIPRQAGQMAEPYATAVGRLAAAELAQTICACQDANRELHRWQYDLAQTGANQEQYGAVSAEDLNNPFGTRRGAVTAWRMLRPTHAPRGLYAG